MLFIELLQLEKCLLVKSVNGQNITIYINDEINKKLITNITTYVLWSVPQLKRTLSPNNICQ